LKRRRLKNHSCAEVYRVFFNPGEVVEIRAYGLRASSSAWEGWTTNIVYGYFDNPEDFGTCAESLERSRAPGIYFTLNPCKPELLARAQNRLKAATAKAPQTSDKDILCLRWLYIDIDREGTSGISSTKEELAAALALRREIGLYLVDEKGFEKTGIVPSMSGNGGHLLCRLPDLENSDENKNFIKSMLIALHERFSTDQVHVDRTTFNPSRICKLYGTTARKGDSTKERPHRRSYIESKFLDRPQRTDKAESRSRI
jgi:hypothetical protein